MDTALEDNEYFILWDSEKDFYLDEDTFIFDDIILTRNLPQASRFFSIHDIRDWNNELETPMKILKCSIDLKEMVE